MKTNKLVGIFLIVLLMGSFSALALTQEEKDLCKERIKNKQVIKETGIDCPKEQGGGGFFIAEDKTLFGMTSKYAGNGFGLNTGNFFKLQEKSFQLNVYTNILSMKIKSMDKQVGLYQKAKGIHFKKVDMKGDLFAYEFLSNLNQKTKYTMKIRVNTQEPISVTLNGEQLKATPVKVVSKSNYYMVEFTGSGLIEVKKAK